MEQQEKGTWWEREEWWEMHRRLFKALAKLVDTGEDRDVPDDVIVHLEKLAQRLPPYQALMAGRLLLEFAMERAVLWYGQHGGSVLDVFLWADPATSPLIRECLCPE